MNLRYCRVLMKLPAPIQPTFANAISCARCCAVVVGVSLSIGAWEHARPNRTSGEREIATASPRHIDHRTLASANSARSQRAGGGLDEETSQQRAVELRSYNLVPGTRPRFHRLVVEQALPLLESHGVDVVAFGPSPHDADSYFLIRAFDDLQARERSEAAFYGSDEWRQGPREQILGLIDSYATIVLLLDDATIAGLREARYAGDLR